MSCKNCKKKLNGNFIAFNPCAFLVDKTKSSVNTPKGTKIDLILAIDSHGKRFKSIDIFEKMNNVSSYSFQHSCQAEEYFCSKKCLLNWFEKLLGKLPNP